LYTGQRRSDVVLLGRQHVHNGKLGFTQQKNRRRKPITLELPILPELQQVLEASPVGELTFLVTEHGRPFAVAGFGNWFGSGAMKRALPIAPRTGCGRRQQPSPPRTARRPTN
jgi:hypothetical protein